MTPQHLSVGAGLALAAAAPAVPGPVLARALELGPTLILLPIALISLVAVLPYAVAEARRSDREHLYGDRHRWSSRPFCFPVRGELARSGVAAR